MNNAERLAEITKMLRKKSKQMIEEPDKWPHWPMLPLKKRGPNLETGLLIDDPEDPKYTVWGGNLFAKPQILEMIKQYENVEQLLDDGWEVD